MYKNIIDILKSKKIVCFESKFLVEDHFDVVKVPWKVKEMSS